MANPEMDSPLGAIIKNTWKCLRTVQTQAGQASPPNTSKRNKRVDEIIDTHIAPACEDCEVDVVESFRAMGYTDEAKIQQAIELGRKSREARLSHKPTSTF